MEFILHVGPMKTGSTALQQVLKFAEPLLVEHGLLPKVVRLSHALLRTGCAIEQDRWLDEVRAEARERGCERVLISNEFLCAQHRIGCLRWILALRMQGHSVRSILVQRPLVELYPSLYLQNLKGPCKRVTGFEEFVQEQASLDQRDCWKRGGNSFNYACLEKRLEHAGAPAIRIRYSRTNLIHDFVRALWPELPFDPRALQIPDEWIGNWRREMHAKGHVDNTRSLSFTLAPVAIEMNKLARAGVLNDTQRNRLMVELLAASTGRGQLPMADRNLLAEIDALDYRLHSDYWGPSRGEYEQIGAA